jgi:Arc/MetJ-type ribon-helix-helix transcriptional regulator
MPYQFPPDIDQLAKKQMASGRYASEDEMLRAAMTALQRRNEEIAAIAAGIDDYEAGRYRPLDEVDCEVRKTFGFGRS